MAPAASKPRTASQVDGLAAADPGARCDPQPGRDGLSHHRLALRPVHDRQRV